jgi:hypothetical protein
MTPSPPPSGRRIYATNAERQAAYRRRKRVDVEEQERRQLQARAGLHAALEELHAAIRAAVPFNLEARRLHGLETPELLRRLAQQFTRP